MVEFGLSESLNEWVKWQREYIKKTRTCTGQTLKRYSLKRFAMYNVSINDCNLFWKSSFVFVKCLIRIHPTQYKPWCSRCGFQTCWIHHMPSFVFLLVGFIIWAVIFLANGAILNSKSFEWNICLQINELTFIRKKNSVDLLGVCHSCNNDHMCGTSHNGHWQR